MQKPLEKNNVQEENTKRHVWDCESSLYDSFELKSFERQLDSAITSTRSLSMPHLTDGRQPQPPPPQQQLQLCHQTMVSSKKTSRISRTLYKLIKSVFKTNKPNTDVPAYQIATNNLGTSSERLYVVYDDRRRNGEVLTTIPEGPEFDVGFSPEIRSLVTRTSSERFSATSIGISCA